MRVLVVNAFGPDDPGRPAAETAVSALEGNGHEVQRIDLIDSGFSPYVTPEERRAYHDEGANLLADEVKSGAEALRRCDAMLFCYPSVVFTVPAVMKGWIERTMVPGVAFVFDKKGRVSPGMRNVRRLGAVTTTPHSRWKRARARDAGRRTMLRSLSLNCSRRCRRTFVALPTDGSSFGSVSSKLRRW